MATAGTPEAQAPAASDIAARLREAAVVRLVAAGTGDAVAAMGLIAGTIEQQGIATHLSVVPLPEPATCETTVDLTLGVGRPVESADLALLADPLAPAALEVAWAVREATSGDAPDGGAQGSAGDDGGSPDNTGNQVAGNDRNAVVLALAGAFAAGTCPPETLTEAADDHLERRPGVALPVTDVADGLAHSTLVHGPFSADHDRAGDLAADEPRTVASALALAVAGDEASTPRGATVTERLLGPHICEQFETVGGYATVLDALTRETPGKAIALALGLGDVQTVEGEGNVADESGGEPPERASLATWRSHARAAHEGLREAELTRYDGLVVLDCPASAPLGVVARLARDYRSPEPAVLAVGDDNAVLTRLPDGEVIDDGAPAMDVGATLRDVATEIGARGDGTATRGRITFDGDRDELVPAIREAQ